MSSSVSAKPDRKFGRLFFEVFVFFFGILLGTFFRCNNCNLLNLKGVISHSHEAFSISIKQNVTGVRHLYFGLASSNGTWPKRRSYVRTWWKPEKINLGVWMQAKPLEILDTDPKIIVSEDIGNLIDDEEYVNLARLSRIIIEAFRMDKSGNIRWFIMGDDDTFFNAVGVAAILSKYDHNAPMYIGSTSETHLQNVNFGFHMAFGGGGFAVSRELARLLNSSMDQCLLRNNEYWGLDERIAACISELGVALTIEKGFHQCDFMGLFNGLMENHFQDIFASLHHFDLLASPLPTVQNKTAALRILSAAMEPDPIGFAQQSFCFDESKESWTMAISWGYAVKFYANARRLFELNRVERTFNGWIDRSSQAKEFSFNTRNYERMNASASCRYPIAFYILLVRTQRDGSVESIYSRYFATQPNCDKVPFGLDKIVVRRKRPMRVPRPANGLNAGTALRRQCCHGYTVRKVARRRETVMFVDIGDCREGEVVAPKWENSKYRAGKPLLPKRRKFKFKKRVKGSASKDVKKGDEQKDSKQTQMDATNSTNEVEH